MENLFWCIVEGDMQGGPYTECTHYVGKEEDVKAYCKEYKQYNYEYRPLLLDNITNFALKKQEQEALEKRLKEEQRRCEIEAKKTELQKEILNLKDPTLWKEKQTKEIEKLEKELSTIP